IDLITIEKPKKLCYRYYAPLPLSELSSSYKGMCGIVIEGFGDGDNVYLICRNEWSLVGTWRIKKEQLQELPRHLGGYTIRSY
ncbi:MAG: hypothetical protein D6828_01580, partial [Nitrospirae bacterium]